MWVFNVLRFWSNCKYSLIYLQMLLNIHTLLVKFTSVITININISSATYWIKILQVISDSNKCLTETSLSNLCDLFGFSCGFCLLSLYYCYLLSPKVKIMQRKVASYTHLRKLIAHGAVIHFIFRECPSPTLPGATQFSCCAPVSVLLAHNWNILSAVYLHPFISSQVCVWLNISINKSQSLLSLPLTTGVQKQAAWWQNCQE